MIYLDNAATTFPSAAALAAFEAEALAGANPSSLHRAGFDAHTRLESARQTIARTVHALPEEILFTSGGTESANLALFGAARARRRRGNTILCSDAEHPCVEETMRDLSEEFGFTLIRIPTKGGVLDLDAVRLAAGRGDVILCAFMRVNNETGAIFDTKTAFDLVRAQNENVFCFSDCVQAYLKEDLSLAALGADAISLSAHKIRALRGAGALVRKKNLRLLPHTFGGGQESGLRSGTENSPAIAAFAAAAAEAYRDPEKTQKTVLALRDALIDGLQSMKGVRVLGVPERVCHIVSAAFPGYKSEVLLHRLSDEGVYVSSGSACSSKKAGKNRVLLNFGLSRAEADSTLRFSISETNTAREIEQTLSILAALLRD